MRTVVALALIQSALPMDYIERLSLVTALSTAVFVLWRQLVKKDQQMVQMVETVTAAMTMVNASNAELRRIIEQSVAAKNKLADSIDELRDVVATAIK